jgi:hypothetical protein
MQVATMKYFAATSGEKAFSRLWRPLYLWHLLSSTINYLTNDYPRYTPVYIQCLLRVISTDKFHFGAVFLPNRSVLHTPFPRPPSLVRSRDM